MKRRYTYITDLKQQLSELPPDSILSQALHVDDQVKVTLFGFAPGQELSEHTAAHPAYLYVLEGSGELILEGDHLRAQPGTWVAMPAHLPHSVRASDRLLLLLVLLRDAKAARRG